MKKNKKIVVAVTIILVVFCTFYNLIEDSLTDVKEYDKLSDFVYNYDVTIQNPL